MLTRDTLTASSRLMLCVYPVFSCYVGLAYLLGDSDRTAGPSLDVIRETLPGGIRTWGGVLLCLTALKLTALVTGNSRLMVVALCVGFGCYIAWAFGILVATLTIPDASLAGPAVWAFIAIAHIASLRSLTIDSQALTRDR